MITHSDGHLRDCHYAFGVFAKQSYVILVQWSHSLCKTSADAAVEKCRRGMMSLEIEVALFNAMEAQHY